MNRSGEWAVVTGASSGIGKALVREFAAQGFNILLTGRNEQALTDVSEECTGSFQVQTQVVPADLSRPESTDQLISVIASTPRHYEVLVNNAGFGVHGDFATTDLESEVNMVNVQLAAALKLTKAVLPGMIERQSGRILNVGSVYCYAPVPFQAVYSACKAFLLSFSAAIRSELSGSGVTVTVFCPGITQTEFRARAGIGEKNRESGMTAADAAHIACVETMKGKPVVVPGLANRLFVLLAKLLPGSSISGLVRAINRKRGQSHR